jgi:hypothetical protein
MAEFRTASLGNVLQTAEALKGMRRQAESDRLRDMYMGVQMRNAEQAGVIAGNQERRDATAATEQSKMQAAQRNYLIAHAAETEADPHSFLQRFAPELVQEINAHYGPETFERMAPEQLKAAMGQAKSFYAANAGLVPQKQDAGFTLSEGQTRFGPDGQPIASVAPKPTKTPARFRPMTAREVQGAGLPVGTAAQVNDDTGQIQVLSKRDASATLSQKDATVAKQKITTINLARQQLANIQQRFNAIKDSLSAGGGGQGRLPTPSGQAFDRAVDQMRSTLTALTKVPGLGAMSDYETRLDQAKFPSRTDYEQVTQQQIDDIAMMLRTLEDGYNGLLTGGSLPTEEPQQPDLSQVSDDDLLRALAGG